MEEYSFGEPRVQALFPLEPQVNPAAVLNETLPSSAAAPTVTNNFAEIAAKVLDLKGLGRPTTFDGREANWSEWEFRVYIAASLLYLASVS